MNTEPLEALKELKALYAQHKNAALEEFYTFLKFPSVSSEAEHRSDIRACVTWLQEYVAAMGFQTELWESEGHHPVLFASAKALQAGQPTLLIYNHYDVQPVDPLELWASPPFAPEVREGEVYARGAQDNKGQCFYVLQALKLLHAKWGALPINIKLCIEGEEECGSAGLSALLSHKRQELKADYLAIVDLGIQAADQPGLTMGLRGIATMDIELSGSKGDLHSGSHGGLAYNPIHALVELLSKLRDPQGKIAIPEFYAEVKELSENEKSKLALNFDSATYEATFGIKATGGERQYPPLERNWLRPSLEINGIWGGYTGTGFKTVIPAKAYAKLSCRLVPDQDPEKTMRKVVQFLCDHLPEGLSLKTHIHAGFGRAVYSKMSSPLVTAFDTAMQEIYGKKCEYIFSGATIPIVTELAAASGGDLILLGLGLPDDNIHAPNEHFGLDRLEKGCLMMARGIELLHKES